MEIAEVFIGLMCTKISSLTIRNHIKESLYTTRRICRTLREKKTDSTNKWFDFWQKAKIILRTDFIYTYRNSYNLFTYLKDSNFVESRLIDDWSEFRNYFLHYGNVRIVTCGTSKYESFKLDVTFISTKWKIPPKIYVKSQPRIRRCIVWKVLLR